MTKCKNKNKMKFNHKPYTDKYFLRTREILEKDGLNPYVRAQVFVRKGPGIISGLDEAVELIRDNSNLEANGGRVYALKDGDRYESGETQMIIEGRIQDFVELETTYLGVLAAGITKANDNIDIDLADVEKRTRQVVQAIGNRPLVYFGARHWHHSRDKEIAAAVIRGGAIGASTDIGASNLGTLGLGTIPHALENIYAWKFGKDNAVLEATKAFDKYMPKEIPRVALIDYNNKEIDDTISVANTLDLSTGRVDTCGENVAQGALTEFDQEAINKHFGREVNVPEEDKKFWTGTGVTISGVYALRKALDNAGHKDLQLMLTSGFGRLAKVEAFTRAEQILETKLFDSLGVGTVYDSRAATMDIVAVGEDQNSMLPMSKVGRTYKANPRLELRLGKEMKKVA